MYSCMYGNAVIIVSYDVVRWFRISINSMEIFV